MENGRIITSDACVAEGALWLASRDPVMAQIIERTAPLPLRLREEGFATLLFAIVGQQVSTASAAAIWSRLNEANLVTEERVAASDVGQLRSIGLSRPKARYALALANSKTDWSGLRDMPDENVIDQLTRIKGIGRWTAEIYAKFALGRADVFAAGDLALQEAARIAYDLPARPTEKELRAMAETWSPWRAVAARALWAYYRVAKDREGIL